MSTPNLIDPKTPTPSSVTQPEALVVKDEAPAQKRRRWPWVLGGFIILGLVIFAPLAYAGISAAFHGKAARANLEQAYAYMSANAFSDATRSLQSARTEIDAARASIQWLGPWRVLPWVSVQVGAFDHALQAGSVGLDAAEQLLTAITRVSEAFDAVSRVPGLETGISSNRSFRDLTREEKRTILARLDQALPEIRSAREKAMIALDAWNQIPQDRMLPPIRKAMEPLTKTLQAYRERSDVGVDLLGLLLPMVGYPQPKTYVVVLQNADELRPTGGFMGTMGVMRFDSGEITQQAFQDVYAYDRTASSTILGVPPEILRRELNVNAWYLRDSNWSPDVPQSAARISKLFADHNWIAETVPSPTSPVPDGVIFLGPEIFTSLLRFTGPITIDGTTFTPDAFFDELQYAVEIGFAKQGIPVEERKQIVAKLGMELFTRLADAPIRRWVELFDVGVNSLKTKDFMIVMQDPALQRAFDAHNWSGRTLTPVQDELWVVDANLAALKTDGVMDKRIEYKVEAKNPAAPIATVRLIYTNTNRAITWRYTRYRDYVRIYVPEGSELISSEGAMAKDLNQTGGRVIPGQVDVMKDLGKTVFGAFWSIEPGQTRELTFSYRLPARVSEPLLAKGEYQLLLQKQPGSHHRLTLDLLFGKKLVAASPPEAPADFGDDRYRATFDLSTDRLVQIRSEK